MPKDPSALFGGLLNVCIREDSFKGESLLRDSIIFTILGIGSSVATVYALSLLGLFV